MPQNIGHYLIDIQGRLLRASAANDAMIDAHFTGDVFALTQDCRTVVDETMAAANHAVMLGNSLGADQRRDDGVKQ